MIIYKISNNINDMVYIGQTRQCINKRWGQHKRQIESENKPLYKAMKKYGIDNFKIEEIDGANNITELNYKEWLLVHKNNTLWPNGYNLREGGGNKNVQTSFSRKKLSKSLKQFYSKNSSCRCKKVINIENGKVYKSLKECCLVNSINYSTLRSKLQGANGNDTPFRYLNHSNNFKKPLKKRKVIDIKNKIIYNSISECAKKNGINYGTLKVKLSEKIKNNTDFRYLGQESSYKKPYNGKRSEQAKKKTSESLKKTFSKKGMKKKLSDRSKKMWAKKGFREKQIEAIKKTNSTEAFKNKMIEISKKIYGNPFNVYKKDTMEFVGTWNTQRECSRDLKVAAQNIGQVLKGKRKYAKGYIFIYKNETV